MARAVNTQTRPVHRTLMADPLNPRVRLRAIRKKTFKTTKRISSNPDVPLLQFSSRIYSSPSVYAVQQPSQGPRDD